MAESWTAVLKCGAMEREFPEASGQPSHFSQDFCRDGLIPYCKTQVRSFHERANFGRQCSFLVCSSK